MKKFAIVVFVVIAILTTSVGVWRWVHWHNAPKLEPLRVPQAIVTEPLTLPSISFPYSVVFGGVHDLQEAHAAVRDPVVKHHYADIDIKKLSKTNYGVDTHRYVSYRIGDNLYWTSKRVTIKGDEAVLFDGQNYIRVRCGNRISNIPMQPTKPNEPSESEFDTLPPSRHSLIATNFDFSLFPSLMPEIPKEVSSARELPNSVQVPGSSISPLIGPPSWPTRFYPPIVGDPDLPLGTLPGQPGQPPTQPTPPTQPPPVVPPPIVPRRPPVPPGPRCCSPPIFPPSQPPTVTPEPSTFVLFGTVLVVVAIVVKQKKR